MLCDSSDTNDALGMCFKCILFMIIQDVLRTSGSSGVLKALLLERNRQLSCNPKKKKKKKPPSVAGGSRQP